MYSRISSRSPLCCGEVIVDSRVTSSTARTWVNFFTSRGQRLYGFCALNSPNSLGSIWFALPEGEIPPSYVYIVMHDRQTNTKYKSNLADTTL